MSSLGHIEQRMTPPPLSLQVSEAPLCESKRLAISSWRSGGEGLERGGLATLLSLHPSTHTEGVGQLHLRALEEQATPLGGEPPNPRLIRVALSAQIGPRRGGWAVCEPRLPSSHEVAAHCPPNSFHEYPRWPARARLV